MPKVYKTRYCCICRGNLWVSKPTFLCNECSGPYKLKNFVMKPVWDNHSGYKLPMRFIFD